MCNPHHQTGPRTHFLAFLPDNVSQHSEKSGRGRSEKEMVDGEDQ
jgi:hypothetical protein